MNARLDNPNTDRTGANTPTGTRNHARTTTQTRKTWLALAAASLVAALLGGCATPAARDPQLTYETLPAGAVLFEGTQRLGQAPVTRTYKLEAGATTVRTPTVTAVWASGAKETFYALLKAGADDVATIERPKAAPGLQTDLAAAAAFEASNAAAAQRNKENQARDLARSSARCKEQQTKGGTAPISDC